MEFKLSGLEIEGLEEKIYVEVQAKNFSRQALQDQRECVNYEEDNYITDQKVVESLLQEITISSGKLNEDMIFNRSTGLLGKIKRLLAKIFRWYIVPLSEQQTLINQETYNNFFRFSTIIIMQQQKIDELRDLLKQNRENH